jgi:hypothetical protein
MDLLFKLRNKITSEVFENIILLVTGILNAILESYQCSYNNIIFLNTNKGNILVYLPFLQLCI